MKTIIFYLIFSLSAFANEIAVDGDAINFKIKDVAGAEIELKNFKGNWVVLEWFNKGCPFVQKHYKTENMQKLQDTYTKKGVKWITIISSAEGKQGYESDADSLKTKEELKAHPTHIIRDTDGKIGQNYGAKTTPHMYIISPDQKVVYQGAIDDIASAELEDVKKAKNLVAEALDAALSKKPILVKKSKSYGCSIKY